MGGILRRFLPACLAIFGVIASSFFFSFTPAVAATVDNLTDQTTSLVVSTAANHKFTFQLVDEWAEGETLTLSFASEFDTSTISALDIDVTDDGVEMSLAGSCVSVDQISAAIAADTVTFTVCNGNGGTIASGSLVVIEIGTNASANGAGTNRITNPSSAGTHYIALGGTSGNDGSLPLPISSTGNSGISVTVTGGGSSPSAGGGGGAGSGGGGGGDSNPEPEPSPEPDPVPDPTPDPDSDPIPDPDVTPSPDPTPDPGSNTPPDTDSEQGPTSSPDETDSPGETDGGSVGEGQNSVDIDIVGEDVPLDVEGGSVDVIPGTTTEVIVRTEGPDEAETVVLVVGNDEYVLSPREDGAFVGVIPVPSSDTALSAVVTYADGDQGVETLLLQPTGGEVYELVNGERVPVSGAVVTVYEVGSGALEAWDASEYGQENPLLSGESGRFGWYVPNGTYTVYATKSGYEEASLTVTVRGNVLVGNLELTREREPIMVLDILNLEQWLPDILQSPEAQTVADVVAPVSTVAAVGSVALLATSFNLFNWLRYLFTSLFLLFNRKRRRAYGVVYNAVTKLPVGLATVRLFSMPDHRLVKTTVTDPNGKYYMLAQPGTYRFEVIKPGFISPSSYLSGLRQDGKYLDLYTGQDVVVNDKDTSITANIPLDPSDSPKYHTPRALAGKRLLRSAQMALAPLGLLFACVALVTSPSPLNWLLLIAQVLVLGASLVLAKSKKPKSWGIVYDAQTRSPVGNTVIRLFEPKYNKLVESTLSDGFGRYSFLLGPNEYYVSFSKPGYSEKIVRPIDYTKKSEPAPLAVDVALEHAPQEDTHVAAARS